VAHRVIARFFHKASDRYIDPGQDCPLLPAEDAARLVRARCLVEVKGAPAAPAAPTAPTPPASRKGRAAGPEAAPPPKE
jgi:hypothetical protein